MMMFPAVALLLLVSPIAADFFAPNKQKDLALAKPLVVPAAEANYHYTMIATGTENGQTSYAKIAVMLLDGSFVFSGVEEQYFSYRKGTCHPFYGSGVVHKCKDEFFLVNSDHVNMQRHYVNQDVQDQSILNLTPCETKTLGTGFPALVKKPVSFGKRWLMSFKPDNSYNKCIGTYDVDDDMFWCMYPKSSSKKFVPLRLPGFLFDGVTGERRQDHMGGQVEIFCMHQHEAKIKKTG